MVMTMETAKVGGLACSAALLVLTDNDGMSESQPTLTMMSTIVMRIVHFHQVNAQEKLNCLCGGNDGVLSERLLEPNRWNVGIAVKELLQISTSSPLPHCLRNKRAILSFKKRPTKSTNKRSHKKFSKLRRRGTLSLRVLLSFGEIKCSRNPGEAPLAQCAQNT